MLKVQIIPKSQLYFNIISIVLKFLPSLALVFGISDANASMMDYYGLPDISHNPLHELQP